MGEGERVDTTMTFGHYPSIKEKRKTGSCRLQGEEELFSFGHVFVIQVDSQGGVL